MELRAGRAHLPQVFYIGVNSSHKSEHSYRSPRDLTLYATNDFIWV
jgi:hypothetical protein